MEVAGLVLGVFPLAISAFKTYRTILSSMKNVSSDLTDIIRDLENEQLILQNTCELLLSGIAADSAFELLSADPFGPGWKQYDDQVRLRLWRSSHVFQERVGEMRQAALDLRQKLAIDDNGEVSACPSFPSQFLA